MPISALKVYSAFAYKTMQERLSYNINLFNEATRGGIVLRAANNQGDFSTEAIYQRISGLVRRRNAYGSGAVASKNLAMVENSSVKVAAGTPPVEISPGQFKWINKNPEEAGVVLGMQLAEETLAEMVSTGVKAFIAAVGQITALKNTATGGNAALGTLATGASKFGDRSGEIGAWLIHSKPMFDIYGAALTNANNLFTFGSIRVAQDGFGRPLVVADLAELLTVDGVAAGVDKYTTLGLSSGAIIIEQNDDFTANDETKNGDENLIRTWQAEWSYNLSIKGFAWDKANGGASPTSAALATATNWDKYAASNKDCAGVIVETR